jgi:hypothetical protein
MMDVLNITWDCGRGRMQVIFGYQYVHEVVFVKPHRKGKGKVNDKEYAVTF